MGPCASQQNVQAMAAQQMLQHSLAAMQGPPPGMQAAVGWGGAHSTCTQGGVPLQGQPPPSAAAAPGSLAAPPTISLRAVPGSVPADGSGLASLAAAALGLQPSDDGVPAEAGSPLSKPALTVGGNVAGDSTGKPASTKLLPLPGSQLHALPTDFLEEATEACSQRPLLPRRPDAPGSGAPEMDEQHSSPATAEAGVKVTHDPAAQAAQCVLVVGPAPA
jgi:hypothetical protein